MEEGYNSMKKEGIQYSEKTTRKEISVNSMEKIDSSRLFRGEWKYTVGKKTYTNGR